MVVMVHVYIQGFADGRKQVLFVQLGIALDSFMIDALGDVTKLSHGLCPEFFIRMSHDFAPPKTALR